MLKILYQLVAIILSVIWPVFAFAKWILSVAGIGTVQDDLPQTLELVWPIVVWIIDMPWWFLAVASLASWVALALLYKNIYSKEVIIKSDHVLVDLRAEKDVRLKFEGYHHALLQPNSATTIQFPKALDEGIYYLYVLCREHGYVVSFSDDFQMLDEAPSTWEHTPHSMTEYKLIVIERSGGCDVFVSNLSAHLAKIPSRADMTAIALSMG